jgi:hypothetical protein
MAKSENAKAVEPYLEQFQETALELDSVLSSYIELEDDTEAKTMETIIQALIDIERDAMNLRHSLIRTYTLSTFGLGMHKDEEDE